MGGDGGGDRLEESAGNLESENDPESRTEEAEEKRFCDEKKDHGVLGKSKRAEETDFGSATNHIGGDGVGDEKHADNKGDKREGGEVELECAEHFFDFLSAAFWGTGSGVGGEVGCEAFEKGGAGCGNFSRGVGAEESFDAVDLAGESKGGLDGGDIRDREVVIGSKEVGGRFKKEANLEVGLMAGGDSADGVAGLKVETVGERAGEGDGVGFGDEGDGVGGGAEGVFEAIGHEFAVREWIDADEMKEFSGVIGEGSDEGECGGDFADGGIVSKERDQFFREAEALAFDCEIGPAGDEVERGAERAEGGFIDGLNRDDGGDPDGESEEVE